jgi:hypothetical protein
VALSYSLQTEPHSVSLSVTASKLWLHAFPMALVFFLLHSFTYFLFSFVLFCLFLLDIFIVTNYLLISHNANIALLIIIFCFIFLQSIGALDDLSCQTAGEWTIYPWIHSNCNSLSDQFMDIGSFLSFYKIKLIRRK